MTWRDADVFWITAMMSRFMKRRRLRVQSSKAFGPFLRIVGFVLAAPICAAQMKVTDSGYEIVLGTMPTLYWVDDDQLLFAGIKRADMETAFAAKDPDRVARLKKLYLWDDTAKSARLYADAQEVCFSNGFVSYRMRVDKAAGKEVVREGTFGSEKELDRPLPPQEVVRSNLTCRAHARNELVPPAHRNHYVVVLREGDGYLHLAPDYGKERQAYPRNLTLHRAKSGEAITLPMTWDENFNQFGIAYSVFRSAYVLPPQFPRGSSSERGNPWPKDQPLVVYLLWADGRTQAASIPHWPAEYLGHPRPMRLGWIFGGGKRPKTGGFYLFDGKVVSKIESGFVREIAVSPDGCKAAVGINNKPYDMGTPINLKVFNFCAGGR
jgi:hypothetical protein